MKISDLDYDLPPELVAQEPPKDRDGGRLMVLCSDSGEVHHTSVATLPALLAPCLWVVNDTQVIPARLRGTKVETGGQVELLLLERLSGDGNAEGGEGPPEREEVERGEVEREEHGKVERWEVMAKAKKLRPSTQATFTAAGITLHARFVARTERGTYQAELWSNVGVDAAVEALGDVPLPPYIRRATRPVDRERYQTVFATERGAVAAPTAGLHFTPRLLAALRERGHRFARITLHVGAGTFRPMQQDPEAHAMHEERFSVPPQTVRAIDEARAVGQPVLAVGTTVVRALESSLDDHGRPTPQRGRTDLFIRPPHRLRGVDGLMTNFHLPRSTLLLLVMAAGGVEEVRRAYRAAVAERYRFYSYGDAMLIVRSSWLR